MPQEKIKIISLLALLLLSFQMTSAQSEVPTETKTLYLKIKNTYKNNDSIFVILSGAENLGLHHNQIAKAYLSYKSAVPGVSEEREFREVAVGKIIILDSLNSPQLKLKEPLYGALVICYNAADTLANGDLLSVEVNIPALPHRSIFSSLALKNILFTNLKSEPLYTLQPMILRDGASMEDSIYGVILNDLHATYEKFKDKTTLPKSLREKVLSGRFKGRSPMEVIRDASREDIEAFLIYSNNLPVKYIGKDYRASETFAGWVEDNSPYSYPEVKAALYPVFKNKEALAKLLPVYAHDIIWESAARWLGVDAMVLANAFNFKDADDMADFALTLAYAVNDTLGKAYAHLSKAQVDQAQEKYAEAILECDKAVSAALLANDKDVELQGTLKKAYCLYKVSKYKEGQIVLEAANKKLAEYKLLIPGSVYEINRQKYYEYKSYILYNSGEYKQALTILDTAIQINNHINSYDAKIRNAAYFTFSGEINNEKGNPKEALRVFEKAIEIYKNNSDPVNRAKVENEMANSYSQLGEYRTSLQFADSALKRFLQAADNNNAGYSCTIKGSAYWELGQYDSAVNQHKTAIELRKKSNNQSGQAFSYKKIGELYLLSGQKTSALLEFDTAGRIYHDIKDSSGLVDIYTKKGEVYLNDDSYKKAADFFEKARGVNSKSNVVALYKLGSAWDAIDTVKAEKYYEESRKLSKSTENTIYEFYSTTALAVLAYRSYDYVKGNQLYEQCLTLAKQLNTDEATANCLSVKAYRFYRATELDSALKYYQLAKNIFDTTDKSQSIWQLNNIANLYISRGDFKKADSTIALALTIAKAISNNIALGNTLQTSSFLYGLTAEFEKGINNNDSAIGIFNRSGNMVRLASTYASRGTLLKYMGEYARSVHSYLFADSVYNDELLLENRGIVLNNIGTTYLSQADYSSALKYFKQSAGFLKPGVVDESYILVQGNIAECLYRLHQNTEAKALMLDILPKAKKFGLNRIGSGIALILGMLYVEEQNLPEANAYLAYSRDMASSSGEKDKLVDALTWLGKINAQQHQADSAFQNYRTAVRIVKQFNIGSGWEANYQLGLLFYEQQKFDSAIVYFKQAVELLDKNAANLYGGEEAKKIFNNDSRKSDLYNKITFSYFKTGDIKEAWGYANRSNIAGIKELSGTLNINSDDKEKSELLRKLQVMQESKKALEKTMEKQDGLAKKETLKTIEILEDNYQNFINDATDKFHDLAPYLKGYNADEFNNYKGELPDDLAVALYLLNDKTLMIFTLTNEKLAVDTMNVDVAPLVKNLIQSIKDTEKQTGTGPLSVRSDADDEEKPSTAADFKDLSNELYNILIETVIDNIGGKKKLCVIPTGIFSNMPFQCLGKKMPGNNFRFLIEDKTIFYTNKMSVFGNHKKFDTTNIARSSFAAFGVPDNTLHYNIDEVNNIGKILGADSTIYGDSRATESMAKQSLRTKKYIHFATHGVLNYSSDFSLSYLKLLPDKDTSNGNNGQLTLREIQGLGIKDCNMVILSACQTAVSKELVKGWNISPANSFLVSNVKTVVASLWKVADEPTELLMEYFYANLSKPMPKAEALREAQIKLSQDIRFRHPNYWGAFVLYGDWK